ncbi:MAG: DUF3576 domain-containing protein [Paracoccaceae bacterium]
MRTATIAILLAALAAGCGDRDLSAGEDAVDTEISQAGRAPQYRRYAGPGVFGTDGVRVGSGADNPLGRLLGSGEAAEDGGSLPVNRFLWRGALDTLSFLPLASTDPFTGVIATDWGATPEAPGERLKVTAYLMDGTLSASALRVAVFREVRGENGAWLPANVDPATPRRIEDAILTRARQIRLAEAGATDTG